MAFNPYYQPNYYNPMGNIPDAQQMYRQPYQQPAPVPAQPMQIQPMFNTDMLWVLNENEAVSYPVAPNNTVILWDKNDPVIYVKSVNAQNVPSIRILDFTERTVSTPKTTSEHVCKCGDKFVKIDDFNALQKRFDLLQAKIEETNMKPAPKTSKTKENIE